MEDDIERFEEERELELYREYRDVLPMFTYVIETERRFYLANKVDLEQLEGGWVKVELIDAWVWDMFRPARFVSTVRVMTQRDVNVEELRREDAASLLDAPGEESASTTRMLEAMCRTGRWSGEVRFRRSNGAEGVCDAVVVPHTDSYGRTVAAIFVYRDITERKRLGERVRELENEKPSMIRLEQK